MSADEVKTDQGQFVNDQALYYYDYCKKTEPWVRERKFINKIIMYFC